MLKRDDCRRTGHAGNPYREQRRDFRRDRLSLPAAFNPGAVQQIRRNRPATPGINGSQDQESPESDPERGRSVQTQRIPESEHPYGLRRGTGIRQVRNRQCRDPGRSKRGNLGKVRGDGADRRTAHHLAGRGLQSARREVDLFFKSL